MLAIIHRMIYNGSLTRYTKLRVAQGPGMPECLPLQRLQRKPQVSNPGMHHGTCVTHVPWCMSGSFTRGGGEKFPGIPDASATRNFTNLVRGPWNETEMIKSLWAPPPTLITVIIFIHIQMKYKNTNIVIQDAHNMATIFIVIAAKQLWTLFWLLSARGAVSPVR